MHTASTNRSDPLRPSHAADRTGSPHRTRSARAEHVISLSRPASINHACSHLHHSGARSWGVATPSRRRWGPPEAAVRRVLIAGRPCAAHHPRAGPDRPPGVARGARAGGESARQQARASWRASRRRRRSSRPLSSTDASRALTASWVGAAAAGGERGIHAQGRDAALARRCVPPVCGCGCSRKRTCPLAQPLSPPLAPLTLPRRLASTRQQMTSVAPLAWVRWAAVCGTRTAG